MVLKRKVQKHAKTIVATDEICCAWPAEVQEASSVTILDPDTRLLS